MLIILIIIKMTSQLFTAPSLPDWRPLTKPHRPGFIQRLRAGGRERGREGGWTFFLIIWEKSFCFRSFFLPWAWSWMSCLCMKGTNSGFIELGFTVCMHIHTRTMHEHTSCELRLKISSWFGIFPGKSLTQPQCSPSAEDAKRKRQNDAYRAFGRVANNFL